VHGKNGFAGIFKNLASYRSENNFVGPSKWLCKTLKLLVSKFFVVLFVMLENPI